MNNCYLLLTNKFINNPSVYTIKFGTWLTPDCSAAVAKYINDNNYNNYRYNFVIAVHDEPEMLLMALKEDIKIVNIKEFYEGKINESED